jgi:hypothetical protein
VTRNMVGQKKVTKQHVLLVALFSLLFFIPLLMIPLFPRSRFLQAIDANGEGVIMLAVFAASTSALVTWISFRPRHK